MTNSLPVCAGEAPPAQAVKEKAAAQANSLLGDQ